MDDKEKKFYCRQFDSTRKFLISLKELAFILKMISRWTNISIASVHTSWPLCIVDNQPKLGTVQVRVVELNCNRQKLKNFIWWFQRPKARYSLLGAYGTDLPSCTLIRWRTRRGWDLKKLPSARDRGAWSCTSDHFQASDSPTSRTGSWPTRTLWWGSPPSRSRWPWPSSRNFGKKENWTW